MRFSASSFAIVATLITLASAANINVTVGANATSTFDPQLIRANTGDTVVFNFVNGTHTVTESLFQAPCVFITTQNASLPGFDSGNRTNGVLNVPITNASLPIFVFDADTCGNLSKSGGVAAINTDENVNSTVTLAGFIRNAERLAGNLNVTNSSSTNSSSSSSSSSNSSSSSTSSASSSSSSSPSSAALKAINMGIGKELGAALVLGLMGVLAGAGLL